jgi:hypothetical protein
MRMAVATDRPWRSANIPSSLRVPSTTTDRGRTTSGSSAVSRDRDVGTSAGVAIERALR